MGKTSRHPGEVVIARDTSCTFPRCAIGVFAGSAVTVSGQGAVGVTERDSGEADDVPARLLRVTVNRYAAPLVIPVTTHLSGQFREGKRTVQILPEGTARTTKTSPPGFGLRSHPIVTATCRDPAGTTVGAEGTVGRASTTKSRMANCPPRAVTASQNCCPGAAGFVAGAMPVINVKETALVEVIGYFLPKPASSANAAVVPGVKPLPRMVIGNRPGRPYPGVMLVICGRGPLAFAYTLIELPAALTT